MQKLRKLLSIILLLNSLLLSEILAATINPDSNENGDPFTGIESTEELGGRTNIFQRARRHHPPCGVPGGGGFAGLLL